MLKTFVKVCGAHIEEVSMHFLPCQLVLCWIPMESFLVQTLLALVYTFTELRLQSPTELLCLTYNSSIGQFAHQQENFESSIIKGGWCNMVPSFSISFLTIFYEERGILILLPTRNCNVPFLVVFFFSDCLNHFTTLRAFLPSECISGCLLKITFLQPMLNK